MEIMTSNVCACIADAQVSNKPLKAHSIIIYNVRLLNFKYYIYNMYIIYIGLNVSSSAHNCGCVVDAMAAI